MQITDLGESTKRFWIVIELQVPREQEEMAGWLMMQLGANGCEMVESDGRNALRATFEPAKLDERDLSPIHAALDEYGLAASLSTLRISKLYEEDWLAEWKKGFEPFAVGESFAVSPPWMREKASEFGNRKIIWVEPGLAFGTGYHDTTRFCLRMVERFRDRKRVLDVGTGSGILAIGFALINCETPVTAVETDPVACKVALENFEINGVGERITLLEGSTDELMSGGHVGHFDLILSNLTCEDNIALLPDYVQLAQPGAAMVFAGILSEKWPRLQKALAELGLQPETVEDSGMWTGVVVMTPPVK